VTERRYALTKVEAGDYLLPSNDARTLWRIVRGDENAGEENERLISVWQLWRYYGRVGNPPNLPDDFLEWSEWELCESWCETRADAIRAALRSR